MRRREWLNLGKGLLLTAAATSLGVAQQRGKKPIYVLAWSERTEPKEHYPEGHNGVIAAFLNKDPNIRAEAVSLNDPEQGLPPEKLQRCDVLIWWGHVRHGEVRDDIVDRIVKRVKDEGMGFIALHSSHYAKPFQRLINSPGHLGGVGHGREEHIWVVAPNHPISKGITHFTLPDEEYYAEPFQVAEPETVVFISTFGSGHWFRSGLTWSVGKGRVFYFRPGHETFPTMKDERVLKIIRNAVYWCARRSP
jgi:trehalose utilization protein